MKFSLICPTRERITNVINLITNLENTISNFDNVELWLCADTDDKITVDYIKTTDKRKIRIFYTVIDKSEYLNKDYYNRVSSYCNGDYLFSIGDDVRFITAGWDKILSEKIEEYLKDKKDRIAYIYVKEVKSQAKHPCFPLITKEAFKVANIYFHPELMSWGADRCLWEVYSHNDIRRICSIPEVEIQHLSYHDKTGEFDKTAQSMKERFFRDPQCHNKCSFYTVPQHIKKIVKHIELIKNKQ